MYIILLEVQYCVPMVTGMYILYSYRSTVHTTRSVCVVYTTL